MMQGHQMAWNDRISSMALISDLLHERIQSFQEVPSSLREDLIVVSLERKPTLLRRTHLLVALCCLGIWYDLLCMSAPSCSCIHEQLGLAVKRGGTRLV